MSNNKIITISERMVIIDFNNDKHQDDKKKPFINDFGVVIGDNKYNSPHSPLNNWSKDTDPIVMAGDQWVHPTNDIGWETEENQMLLKYGYIPRDGRFMHPTLDVSYKTTKDTN